MTAKKRKIVSKPIRRLLDLMELPESMLTKSELAELDAYVAAQTARIRASWTPEQEAAARGVSFRIGSKQIEHDGRMFQASPGLVAVDTTELGIDCSQMSEREHGW